MLIEIIGYQDEVIKEGARFKNTNLKKLTFELHRW